ncbi:UDP-glycosyltransferase 86A1 [Capsicum annuum]|nr:UDP-glycosyltransferase 86A1 [Capsicum annuum]
MDSISNPHAILVCYPLQGHVIPTTHLAIKLAQKGFTITFINTESTHYQITQKKGKTETFSNVYLGHQDLDIRYMIVSDGLPVNFDRSLNHDQFMASLLHVFSAHVEEALVKTMESKMDPPVNCLIADSFFVFPGKLAKKYGLLYISFWTETALVFTLYYHLHLLKLHGHFGCIDLSEDPIDYIPGVKSIKPKDLMSYLQETDTTSMCHQIIFNAFKDVRNADFILCNTILELESETISALQIEKPFYAIGPIFPPEFTNSGVSTSMWFESECTHWLDMQQHATVMYVSFGSYAHITKNELLEIAYGLCLSKVGFIWVIRPDIVSSDDPNPLPEDFESEICGGGGGRGLVVPWCCQKRVLAHSAIGGFLTHCGWNSILEAIWCEVPMLCYPLLTDQFTNRKLVVDDWKIGLNLCDKKPITKVEISKKIHNFMYGKLSDECRNVIKKVKKTFGNALSADGSSERNLDNFIGKVFAVKADITDPDEVKSLFNASESVFQSPVSILVNAAGTCDVKHPMIMNTAVEDFGRTFSLNTRGAFLCCKEAVANRMMIKCGERSATEAGADLEGREGGRIICVTSSAAASFKPGNGEAMVKILAKELKGTGIPANCVAPGPIATEMFFKGRTEEMVKKAIDECPHGRLGQSEDVAPVIRVLAGDTS